MISSDLLFIVLGIARMTSFLRNMSHLCSVQNQLPRHHGLESSLICLHIYCQLQLFFRSLENRECQEWLREASCFCLSQQGPSPLKILWRQKFGSRLNDGFLFIFDPRKSKTQDHKCLLMHFPVMDSYMTPNTFSTSSCTTQRVGLLPLTSTEDTNPMKNPHDFHISSPYVFSHWELRVFLCEFGAYYSVYY